MAVLFEQGLGVKLIYLGHEQCSSAPRQNRFKITKCFHKQPPLMIPVFDGSQDNLTLMDHVLDVVITRGVRSIIQGISVIVMPSSMMPKVTSPVTILVLRCHCQTSSRIVNLL